DESLLVSMSKQKPRAKNDEATPAGLSLPSAFFLRTKLLPPRPAPEILARPRLIERLQANLTLPVTLVTANAGSGKTTLVADFIRKQEHPYIWYQLDHTDADAAVFLGYLTFGIQQRVAEFGEKTFARSEEHTSELQSRENLVCRLLLEKKK